MCEINVQVQLYGAAQMANGGSGQQRIHLSSSATIQDLLDNLYRNIPSMQCLLEGKEHSLHALIMVNALDIKRREGVQTILKNGDKVDIISSISGG